MKPCQDSHSGLQTWKPWPIFLYSLHVWCHAVRSESIRGFSKICRLNLSKTLTPFINFYGKKQNAIISLTIIYYCKQTNKTKILKNLVKIIYRLINNINSPISTHKIHFWLQSLREIKQKKCIINLNLNVISFVLFPQVLKPIENFKYGNWSINQKKLQMRGHNGVIYLKKLVAPQGH